MLSLNQEGMANTSNRISIIGWSPRRARSDAPYQCQRENIPFETQADGLVFSLRNSRKPMYAKPVRKAVVTATAMGTDNKLSSATRHSEIQKPGWWITCTNCGGWPAGPQGPKGPARTDATEITHSPDSAANPKTHAIKMVGSFVMRSFLNPYRFDKSKHSDKATPIKKMRQPQR